MWVCGSSRFAEYFCKSGLWCLLCVFMCCNTERFHRHLLRADCTKSQPLPIASAPVYSTNESYLVKTHLCVIVWPHKKSFSEVTAVSDVGLHPGPVKQILRPLTVCQYHWALATSHRLNSKSKQGRMLFIVSLLFALNAPWCQSLACEVWRLRMWSKSLLQACTLTTCF